jgi:hypothetical protein
MPSDKPPGSPIWQMLWAFLWFAWAGMLLLHAVASPGGRVFMSIAFSVSVLAGVIHVSQWQEAANAQKKKDERQP